jgi:hypothetical protein
MLKVALHWSCGSGIALLEIEPRRSDMKIKLLIALLILAIAPAAHASAVFQGMTFTFTQIDTDTLQFDLTGTPSGDWTGVNYLGAFAIKDIGFDFSTGTGTANGPGATNLASLNSQLSSSNIDCSATGGGNYIGCWDISPDNALGALPFHFTYTIDFTSPLNISLSGPHLQIVFTNTLGGDKVGSLFSQNVALGSSSSGTPSSGVGSSGQVPEPATGSLVVIGLALLGAGFGFRRRSLR